MTDRTVYAAVLTAALPAVGITQPVLAASPAIDAQIVETVHDQELSNFGKFKFKKFHHGKFKKKKFFYGY